MSQGSCGALGAATGWAARRQELVWRRSFVSFLLNILRIREGVHEAVTTRGSIRQPAVLPFRWATRLKAECAETREALGKACGRAGGVRQLSQGTARSVVEVAEMQTSLIDPVGGSGSGAPAATSNGSRFGGGLGTAVPVLTVLVLALAATNVYLLGRVDDLRDSSMTCGDELNASTDSYTCVEASLRASLDAVATELANLRPFLCPNVVNVWNETRLPCKVPSPTDFEYPSTYSVQPMLASVGFTPTADRWSEGRDDLSEVDALKYAGGVLLPDGRVVLAPTEAKHMGLYDAGGTRNGAAYSVAAVSDAVNALLLPYYNKF